MRINYLFSIKGNKINKYLGMMDAVPGDFTLQTGAFGNVYYKMEDHAICELIFQTSSYETAQRGTEAWLHVFVE